MHVELQWVTTGAWPLPLQFKGEQAGQGLHVGVDCQHATPLFGLIPVTYYCST